MAGPVSPHRRGPELGVLRHRQGDWPTGPLGLLLARHNHEHRGDVSHQRDQPGTQHLQRLAGFLVAFIRSVISARSWLR